MNLILAGSTLLLTGLLAGLFAWRINWGVALFIFALPFERIGAYPLNPTTGYPLLHPAQIVGAALIGAFVIRLLLNRSTLRAVPSLKFLLAFLVSALVSALINRVGEVNQIFVWLVFISCLFYAVAVISSRANLRLIRRALAVTVLVVSLFGIYQFLGNLAGLPNQVTGIRDRYSKTVLGFPRLQSTALEPLYFANYLFLPLLVLLALVIQADSADKLTWLGLISGLAAFALTFSRGAFVSGLAGLVVLVVCLRDRFGGWAKTHFSHILLVLFGLVVLAGVLVGLSVHQTKGSRTGNSILKDYFTLRVVSTGSFTERFHDEKLALTIWRKHPIFGVGIGGFGSAYYGCHIGKCVYRPNNQALEVLAEGGIVGFIAFHLFLLSILYFGWRAMKGADPERRAMLAGLIAATVAMVVQSQTFSGFLCCLTYTWGTLGLLAGLSLPKQAKGSD